MAGKIDRRTGFLRPALTKAAKDAIRAGLKDHARKGREWYKITEIMAQAMAADADKRETTAPIAKQAVERVAKSAAWERVVPDLLHSGDMGLYEHFRNIGGWVAEHDRVALDNFDFAKNLKTLEIKDGKAVGVVARQTVKCTVNVASKDKKGKPTNRLVSVPCAKVLSEPLALVREGSGAPQKGKGKKAATETNAAVGWRGMSAALLTPGGNGGQGELQWHAVYALVPIKKLRLSHDAEGQPTNKIPDYMHEPGIVGRIQRAEYFGPFVLSDNPTTQSGPPVVDRKWRVLSGTDRVIAIQNAGVEYADDLRRALVAHTIPWGLWTLAERTDLSKYVVVRVIQDEFNPKEISGALNAGWTASADMPGATLSIAPSAEVPRKLLEHLARRMNERRHMSLGEVISGCPHVLKMLVDAKWIDLSDPRADSWIWNAPNSPKSEAVLSLAAVELVERAIMGEVFASDRSALLSLHPDIVEHLRSLTPMIALALRNGLKKPWTTALDTVAQVSQNSTPDAVREDRARVLAAWLNGHPKGDEARAQAFALSQLDKAQAKSVEAVARALQMPVEVETPDVNPVIAAHIEAVTAPAAAEPEAEAPKKRGRGGKKAAEAAPPPPPPPAPEPKAKKAKEPKAPRAEKEKPVVYMAYPWPSAEVDDNDDGSVTMRAPFSDELNGKIAKVAKSATVRKIKGLGSWTVAKAKKTADVVKRDLKGAFEAVFGHGGDRQVKVTDIVVEVTAADVGAKGFVLDPSEAKPVQWLEADDGTKRVLLRKSGDEVLLGEGVEPYVGSFGDSPRGKLGNEGVSVLVKAVPVAIAAKAVKQKGVSYPPHGGVFPPAVPPASSDYEEEEPPYDADEETEETMAEPTPPPAPPPPPPPPAPPPPPPAASGGLTQAEADAKMMAAIAAAMGGDDDDDE